MGAVSAIREREIIWVARYSCNAIFDAQTKGEDAWQVGMKDGKLRWSDGVETFDSDPMASFGWKFQAWFARTFHLVAQL